MRVGTQQAPTGPFGVQAIWEGPLKSQGIVAELDTNEGPQKSCTNLCLRVSGVQEVNWGVGFKEDTIINVCAVVFGHTHF